MTIRRCASLTAMVVGFSFAVSGSATATDTAAHAIAEKFAGGAARDEEAARKAEAEKRKVAEAKRKTEEAKRKKAEAARKKAEEAKRLAAEEAEMLERARREAVERKAAQDKARAEEEAARLAEEQRLADEKRVAEEKRRAEEQRLAHEREEAERAAKARRLAEEQRIAREKYVAELQRRDEEERLAEERRIAEEKRLAEEARRSDEQRLAQEREEAERAAKARRLAEEQRAAREKYIAEQQRRAEEERLAEERRIAEEKRLAEETLRAEEQRRADERERSLVAARDAEHHRLTDRLLRLDQQRKSEAKQLAERPMGLGARPPSGTTLADRSAHPARLPRAAPPTTRVTVLLIMEPGTRGIRRYGRKTADPVLCSGPTCWVSGGADRTASARRRMQVLGSGNTLGHRAADCNHHLACAFRNIDLKWRVATVQPIDLRILRHDRREFLPIEADTSCRVTGGVLHCAKAYTARTWRAWVVPEHVAQQAGTEALEAALASGLSGRTASTALIPTRY